jgi:hypothetical protein
MSRDSRHALLFLAALTALAASSRASKAATYGPTDTGPKAKLVYCSPSGVTFEVHLRQQGPIHVRGCFALDHVLGKE